MGLLQKAVETYDAHAAWVGKERAGHQTLAPIGHNVTNADIEITVDGDGKLVDVMYVEKKNAKTIIPVTEMSSGRTIAPCAHPLCDQVGYLSGENDEKYQLYTRQLEEWCRSEHFHPMLMPILTYVKGKSLVTDLQKHGIEPADKNLIRFRVIGIGEESGACWTNRKLFDAFTAWYETKRESSSDEKELCMVSGEFELPASQHPKGIIPIYGNAKIISTNDKSGFTYRGRFTDDGQAATIGYRASQKAHNALRWLAAEQGARVIYGGRTFLCWNPKGKSVPHVGLPFMTGRKLSVNPTDYRKELQNTLNGFRTELPETEDVVIAAFDAATTGRLAVTYYNELRASDFLERLKDWDESCCWWSWNPEHRRYDAVEAVSLRQIVTCAFGTATEEKGRWVFATDERVMRQQMQRLITCRVDRGQFPTDIEHSLVMRASSPQSYERKLYTTLLITACAVIRRYHRDHQKEDLKMQLEEERMDRSYLFGCLLAIMEKAERDTYTDVDGERETNAIRLQSAYCQHPLHTANIIESQLERAYFPRLKPGTRAFYKKQIGAIMEKLDKICQEMPQNWNRALGDTYLIGYYLQRSALYASNEKKEEKE